MPICARTESSREVELTLSPQRMRTLISTGRWMRRQIALIRTAGTLLSSQRFDP